jgi:hypothetical protein
MKSASTVYDALQGFVRQSAWADVRHMAVLVWMMIGMIEEGKVNLTCWISRVQTKAVYAQSTQRRFSRWLHNPRINVARLYGPIIQAALSKWQDSELLLSLDTSMLWDSYCIIRLSVVYRGRAIPVGWRVIEHKSSSVQLSVYQDLLKRVAGLLPSGVKVVLLADRGFVDAELMRYVRNSLNWHYRIRLKGNVWFYRAGRGWRQVKQLHLTAGEAVLLHQVRVYKKHSLTGVHLAVAKVAGTNEDWYILSSEPTTLKTLAEYGLRFDIEIRQLQYPHTRLSFSRELSLDEIVSWTSQTSLLKFDSRAVLFRTRAARNFKDFTTPALA